MNRVAAMGRDGAVGPSMAGGHQRSFAVIASALFWRSWREQRRRAGLLFLGSFLLWGGLCASVVFAPGLLTGATRAALHHMIQDQPDIAQSGSASLLGAFLLGQGPFLLAVLAAAAAGNLTRAMIAFDVERSGFEVLLSAPYKPRALFAAYIFAGVGVTGIAWGCLAIPGIGVSIAAGLYSGVTVGHLGGFLALGLLTSVALALWASTATMYASISAPGLMGLQSGAGTVIPQLVAVFPGLIIFAVINIFAGVNLLLFGALALAGSLACAAIVCVALGRSFSVSRLLTSH